MIQTIPEQIAHRLRTELLAGKYLVGEALRETPLAKQFGVSRGPIRQVLQQLSQEGLLVANPNRGVTVAPPASATLRDLLIPLRSQIEVYALRLCYASLSPGDFADWQLTVDNIRAACVARDYSRVLEGDCEFHRFLLRRAGQSEVLPIWTHIMNRARPTYSSAQRAMSDLRFVAALHQEMLDVFRSGDLEAAAQALAEHIADTGFNDRARARYFRGKGRRSKSPKT